MTDVQICNLALARLGDARITTLADATAQAQYCTLFYVQTVAELQAEFDWQFCRKLVNLTSSTTPLGGYTFQYALPSDYIRSIRLANIDESENFGQWEILGSSLQTNFASPVTLDYIANIADTTKFPAIFTELLGVKLAGVLAMPLTGSKDLFKQCIELYGAMLQKPAFLHATKMTASARIASVLSASEICRQAIMRLGTTDILTQTGGHPILFATSFYDHCLEELLSEIPWAFAKKQASIAANATAPTQGYTRRYAIPADYIQLLRVNNIDASDNFALWEIVGGFIHTDLASPIIIDYTGNVSDVSLFPAPFSEALITRLAAKIALPLTAKGDLATALAQAASETLTRPSIQILADKSAKPRTGTAANTVAEICRQALLRVGNIETLKAFGEPMAIATSLFDQTRNEVLSDFDWQFARFQSSLPADATPPAFGYTTRYLLPQGTLKVLRVNGVDEDENFGNWELVAGYIHTNFPTPIKVETTQIVTDASKYPPVFANMLTVTLAIKLSQIIE